MKTLAFLFLVIPALSFSRSDTLSDGSLFVRFQPLSLISVYAGPSARVSAEYKVRGSVSFENEVGFFFYRGTGFLTRFEVKKYLSDKSKTGGNYFSAELFYKFQRYTTDAFVDTSDYYEQNYIILPAFDVSKNVECFTVKFGQMNVYKFGITTDIFVGLGIRFQQNRNSLSAEDNAAMPPTSDYGPNLILNKAGNRIYPNLAVGLKIGFRLKK